MAKKENRHAELVSASANIEAPYELPEGWTWCRLGDVAEIARGGSPRPIEKYLTSSNDGINWIKIGDAEKDGKYIFSTKEKIIKEGLSKTRYVEEGDFLLTNSMSFGRPYILKVSGCIHDGWLVIKKCTAYNQDFLYYLLSSPGVFNQFVSLAKGSTVKNLKSETVRQVILPLPTLAEQERIVNRIEIMFAKLDRAQEKAQSVLDSFETRKAAILHKAFTGQLTANWRKENGVADDSWEEKTLQDVCKSIYDGDHMPPPKADTGVYFLVISNVNTGYLSFENTRFVTEEYFENLSETRKPSKGDILYTLVGSYGIPVVVDCDTSFCFQRHMALFKPKSIDTYFLWYLLQTNEFYNKATEIATGTAQLTVPIKGLRKIVIKVPCEAEQKKLVHILNTILEKESKAKEAAEAVLEQIDLLKKSILARAFRGEL